MSRQSVYAKYLPLFALLQPVLRPAASPVQGCDMVIRDGPVRGDAEPYISKITQDWFVNGVYFFAFHETTAKLQLRSFPLEFPHHHRVAMIVRLGNQLRPFVARHLTPQFFLKLLAKL